MRVCVLWCKLEGPQPWGKGLKIGKSVKRFRCLCGARRACSRGAVRLPGSVVVVVGVDLLVRSLVDAEQRRAEEAEQKHAEMNTQSRRI